MAKESFNQSTFRKVTGKSIITLRWLTAANVPFFCTTLTFTTIMILTVFVKSQNNINPGRVFNNL